MSDTPVLPMGGAVGAQTQTQINPFKQGSLFAEDVLIPEPTAQVLMDALCRQESPEVADGVLRVVGVAELTAAHGRRFRKQVLAALHGHTSVEIDLSPTTAIDCAGVGALIAIRNFTHERKGVVRLVKPSSPVRQLLDLMRAGEIFEIVHTSS
jgi:anti-anti-sigma factor